MPDERLGLPICTRADLHPQRSDFIRSLDIGALLTCPPRIGAAMWVGMRVRFATARRLTLRGFTTTMFCNEGAKVRSNYLLHIQQMG